ncbi:MAG: biotin/lipoyl-containing protein [Ilumatobacteraceae bacterium]
MPDQPLVVAGGAGAKAAPKSRKSSGGSGGGGAGSGDVVVPMQGTIVKVLVEVGQAVEAGQAVVVPEAMKMENQIQAEKAGTVKAIKVEAGATVGAATSWSSSSDPGPPGRRDRAHGPADRDGDRPGRGRPSTGPAQVTPGLVAGRTTTVPATKRPVTPGLVAGTPPPCRRDQTPGRTRFGRRRTTTVSARPNARSHPVWSPGDHHRAGATKRPVTRFGRDGWGQSRTTIEPAARSWRPCWRGWRQARRCTTAKVGTATPGITVASPTTTAG